MKTGEKKSDFGLFGGKVIIACGQDHLPNLVPQTHYMATVPKPDRRARSVILRTSDL